MNTHMHRLASTVLAFSAVSISIAAIAGASPAATGAQSHPGAVSTTPVRRGGEVRIVAPSGGDFTTIQAAVNASAPGDTVLVKQGTYPAFIVNGKGINVVEEAGANVQVNGLIAWRVDHIPAGQVAVITGLRGQSSIVANNSGAVRFEDCTVTGYLSVYVSSCEDVCFSESSFTGELGYSGISVGGSSLALYHSECNGGLGAPYDLADEKDPFGGADGGNGVQIYMGSRTFLFAAGSGLHGGQGGMGFCPGGTGGAGGWGIIGPVDSVALETTLTAGEGGEVCGVPGPGGSPGAFGNTFSGSARRVMLETPVRDSSVVPISFIGEPGDFVTLFVSRGTAHVYEPDLRGVRMVESPYHLIVHAGYVPPSGILNTTLRVEDSWTSPHTASLFFVQALFTDSNGESTLSNPTNLVVLDHVY